MTVRPSLHVLLLAVVLGALCAFAVACGEEREGLIPASRAGAIKERLDQVDEDVASERCDALQGHLAGLRREIDGLPGSVDRRLRRRLREGLEILESRAPEECSIGSDRTETEPETTPETVPTETLPETVPPETTPPETTPTQTTPPETTPTETVPEETTPPETLPPGESGGEQAPLGGGTENP